MIMKYEFMRKWRRQLWSVSNYWTKSPFA